MARAIGLQHDPGKVRGCIIHSEDVTCNCKAAKGVFTGEVRRGVMFIGPLDERVIDIVTGNNGLHVRIGQNQTGYAWPIRDVVTLEPVVADNQVAISVQDHRCPKPLETAITDLGVVCINIETQTYAVRCRRRLFIGSEVTPIKLKILASAAMARNTTMLGFGDKTILEVECLARGRKKDAAGFTLAMDFDIGQRELGKLGKAGKIKHILEARERIRLRYRRRKKRLAQGNCSGAHILVAHVNLGPDSHTFDQRTDLDIGDTGDIAQNCRRRSIVIGRAGLNRRIPVRAW